MWTKLEGLDALTKLDDWLMIYVCDGLRRSELNHTVLVRE